MTHFKLISMLRHGDPRCGKLVRCPDETAEKTLSNGIGEVDQTALIDSFKVLVQACMDCMIRICTCLDLRLATHDMIDSGTPILPSAKESDAAERCKVQIANGQPHMVINNCSSRVDGGGVVTTQSGPDVGTIYSDTEVAAARLIESLAHGNTRLAGGSVPTQQSVLQAWLRLQLVVTRMWVLLTECETPHVEPSVTALPSATVTPCAEPDIDRSATCTSANPSRASEVKPLVAAARDWASQGLAAHTEATLPAPQKAQLHTSKPSIPPAGSGTQSMLGGVLSLHLAAAARVQMLQPITAIAVTQQTTPADPEQTPTASSSHQTSAAECKASDAVTKEVASGAGHLPPTCSSLLGRKNITSRTPNPASSLLSAVSKVDLTVSNVDLAESNVNLAESNVDLTESDVDLTDSKYNLAAALVGHVFDACGVSSSCTEAAAWELFAFTYLDGPILPGCGNMSCVNLNGRSEAEMATRLCSGCRRARYCSRACQKAAWVGGHKAVCVALRGAAAGACADNSHAVVASAAAAAADVDAAAVPAAATESAAAQAPAAVARAPAAAIVAAAPVAAFVAAAPATVAEVAVPAVEAAGGSGAREAAQAEAARLKQGTQMHAGCV